MIQSNEQYIEDILVGQLKYHLNGLKTKIENDFCEASFKKEIKKLQSDPIYPLFYLDNQDYALIRFMGRMSVSIGRRLGEIYDKIPRQIAQIVFNIAPAIVSPKFNGLELDTCLPLKHISKEDSEHIIQVVKKYLGIVTEHGVGIEVRYNFNPNDSARLRKDVNMVEYLQAEGLTPIYIVFSSISPRQDAISRLTRAGWNFLVGEAARDFSKDIYGIDLSQILKKEKISATIKSEMDDIMKTLYCSHAFSQVSKKFL